MLLKGLNFVSHLHCDTVLIYSVLYGAKFK